MTNGHIKQNECALLVPLGKRQKTIPFIDKPKDKRFAAKQLVERGKHIRKMTCAFIATFIAAFITLSTLILLAD